MRELSLINKKLILYDVKGWLLTIFRLYDVSWTFEEYTKFLRESSIMKEVFYSAGFMRLKSLIEILLQKKITR